MIKVRKSGAWVDATTYKRMQAGVWEWVNLGKRYHEVPNTKVALSRMLFPSNTGTAWETLGTATSNKVGTTTWSVDNIRVSSGSSAYCNITSVGSRTVSKFYVEVDIVFTDTPSSVGEFIAVGTDGFDVAGFVNITGSLVGDDFRVGFKDMSSGYLVYSNDNVIAIDTRCVIRVEVDLVTQSVEFFVNDVSVGIGDITPEIPATYYIQQALFGDVNESYGSNKFNIYRAEYGTHSNTIGS